MAQAPDNGAGPPADSVLSRPEIQDLLATLHLDQLEKYLNVNYKDF